MMRRDLWRRRRRRQEHNEKDSDGRGSHSWVAVRFGLSELGLVAPGLVGSGGLGGASTRRRRAAGASRRGARARHRVSPSLRATGAGRGSGRELLVLLSELEGLLPERSVLLRRVGQGPAADTVVRLFEGRHHLAREARKILLHDLLRRPERTRDHDVLEPRIAALDVLQIADELLGGAAEPGAVLHAVLD